MVDAELRGDRPDRPAVDEVVTEDVVLDLGIDLFHRSPAGLRSHEVGASDFCPSTMTSAQCQSKGTDPRTAAPTAKTAGARAGDSFGGEGLS